MRTAVCMYRRRLTSPSVSTIWTAGKPDAPFRCFHASDILNSTRTTLHITTENYVEDSMYNQLGRHFFITFKWNFGKLNAAQSRKASQAAMGMMF